MAERRSWLYAPAVATVEERLARLEAESEAGLERLVRIEALLNSGPGVPWEQSVRGKLHAMRDTLAAADKLAEAAREVRRVQSRRWSRAQVTVATLCAIAVAAAPYVALFASR